MKISGSDFLDFLDSWRPNSRLVGLDWKTDVAERNGLHVAGEGWKLEPDSLYDLPELGEIAPIGRMLLVIDTEMTVSRWLQHRNRNSTSNGETAQVNVTPAPLSSAPADGASEEEPQDAQTKVVVVRVPKLKVSASERAARKAGAKILRGKSNGLRVFAVDYLDWKEYGLPEGLRWNPSETGSNVDVRTIYDIRDLGSLVSANSSKTPTISSLFRTYMRERDTVPVAAVASPWEAPAVRSAMEVFSRLED